MFWMRNRVPARNHCGTRFFCCNAVAERWNLNNRLAVFRLLAVSGLFRPRDIAFYVAFAG